MRRSATTPLSPRPRTGATPRRWHARRRRCAARRLPPWPAVMACAYAARAPPPPPDGPTRGSAATLLRTTTMEDGEQLSRAIRRDGLRTGARDGLPFALAGLLVSVSFGVLAKPVLGVPATLVMSAFVFAGSAQFAALAVLASGGGAVTAILAGVLLNLRFVPMGIAIAPS